MLGEKLKEALENKKNDVKTFEWKYAKTLVNGVLEQKSKKLVDMSEVELQECMNYCNTMLYNDNPKTLGRMLLLDVINTQRHNCNVALFIRWVETQLNYPKFRFLELINGFIEANREEHPNLKTYPIQKLFTNGEIPSEYKHLTLDDALNGCLDRLGKFDKKPITLRFLTKQGLWFTADEIEELTEKTTNGTTKDRLEVIKERLLLKNDVKLHIYPNGLSYKQFRAMISLKNKRYCDLTFDQLETLRDKVLFNLEIEVRRHVDFWKNKIIEINKVIESRQ